MSYEQNKEIGTQNADLFLFIENIQSFLIKPFSSFTKSASITSLLRFF